MLLSLFCYISPVKLVTQNKATPNLFLILLHFCLQHFEQANINNFNFNYVFCLDQHHNMVSSCTFYSYCSKTLISLKWKKFFFFQKQSNMSFSFGNLCCLFFFDLRILITPLYVQTLLKNYQQIEQVNNLVWRQQHSGSSNIHKAILLTIYLCI
jgi:hypothetical protein